MSKHRKPKFQTSKRPTQDFNTGDRIIRARMTELLWRVAHAARATLARATQWAPEMEGCGAAAYAILDHAIDDLDAHVRSGAA